MTGENGALTLDFDDEIIKGACITRGGEIVHEGARKAADLGGGEAPVQERPEAEQSPQNAGQDDPRS
jgi:hypothetical protein